MSPITPLLLAAMTAGASVQVEIPEAPFPMPAIAVPEFAEYGVQLEGDPLLPPSGIRVRNVKVGRVTKSLSSVTNCVDVKIEGLVGAPSH